MTGIAPGGDPMGLAAPRGKARRDRGELGRRILSAAVMAALALATAVEGGWVFDLFWLIAALAILWEWLGLVDIARRPVATLPGAAALAAVAAVAGTGSVASAIVALVLGAGCTALVAQSGSRAVSAGGPIYAGALLTAVVILRHASIDGLEVILWLFAVVWGTDTFAYFGGRLIGGPKLAPRLSPSKTWSGFVVGVTAGALLGLLVAPRSGCLGCVIAAGLAGGVLAQAGDLFESALKRRFGVKDAGSLIPGHGGVMDRLDGFLAAAVLAATVGLWRFGAPGSGAGLLQW